MNTEHIKNEFNTNYKPKIQSFFSPLQPLRKAILTFCHTTLWMVVLVIIILMLLFKIIGWYYHHKYMRNHYNRWYYYHSRSMQPNREYHNNQRDNTNDIFSRTERYIDTQRRMMQERMNAMRELVPPTVMRVNDGTGVQQSLSRIYTTNWENKWYTLTVRNNTIQWSLIGPIQDNIKEWLEKNNISLDSNNFSVVYSPELFDTITTLLESQQ